MLECSVILLFIAVLIGCLALNIPVVYSLVAGYVIFFLYGIKKGYTAQKVFKMSLCGVKTVKNLLITFVLIGMLTALWRASGTIPMIICYTAKLIHPFVFILVTFLLNCLISFLTGTSFGTAATMGVICMTMAQTIGVNPVFAGGAILSGIFFGDRCSPVSTSAMLVREVTGTDLYENIRGMIKTAMVPFALSCGIYLILGFFSGGSGEIMDMGLLFGRGFALHWILVLPALFILLMAVLRVQVKMTLLISIITAAVLSIFVQKIGPLELIRILLWGYKCADPKLASMMNGGGILSMASTALIVGLSSSYAGIFEETGLLDGMKQYVAQIADKVTAFGAMMLISVVTIMVACNQTLSAILTNQLCKDVEPDKKERAICLENTVIVIAPLIPWSIAGVVPLATIGAPSVSILAACYLYLIPLWNLVVRIQRNKLKEVKKWNIKV